jgi:hypothetical protein
MKFVTEKEEEEKEKKRRDELLCVGISCECHQRQLVDCSSPT